MRGASERLQFLAGLEAHRLARRNGDFRAGARVPSDAGLARPHIEDPESAQFDALAAAQGALHALEDRFYRHLRFGLRDSGLVDHLIDDV